MQDKAKTPFLLADVGGSYFMLTENFPTTLTFLAHELIVLTFDNPPIVGITNINSDLRPVWNKLTEWLERLT